MATSDEWKAVLEKTELARDLTALELSCFFDLFEPRTLHAGSIVFEENSTGRELFLVVEGRVSIVMHGINSNDDRILMNDVGPGYVFGEISLVDGAPRSAQAKTALDSTLLMLREVNFRHLAEKEPRLGYVVMRNLGRTLSERLRTTNYKLRNTHDWVSLLGALGSQFQ